MLKIQIPGLKNIIQIIIIIIIIIINANDKVVKCVYQFGIHQSQGRITILKQGSATVVTSVLQCKLSHHSSNPSNGCVCGMFNLSDTFA